MRPTDAQFFPSVDIALQRPHAILALSVVLGTRMHIILGLLTLIGVIALWVWRARMAGEASREVVDASEDVQAAFRRYGYRRQAGKHPAENLDDPRLAAAGMMAAIARLEGDMSTERMNAIRVECRASFRLGDKEADEIAAFGRWLAEQSKDPDDAVRRLLKIVRDKAPREAHEDMIAMLTRVASVEGGGPNDLQKDSIARVRRGLGLS